MRTRILTILLIGFSITSNAQNNNNEQLLKMATTAYQQLRYAYAIPLFKEYIKKQPENGAAILTLANTYKINNQYDSAAKYYAQAKAKGATVGNNLAESYASKGNYSEAVKASDATVNKSRLNGFKDVAVFKRDSLDYTLHFLAINTPFNEYAVLPYKEGILFESNRAEKIKNKNEFGWDGAAFSNLFFTNNLKTIPVDSADLGVWSEKTLTLALADISAQRNNDNTTLVRTFDYKNITYNTNGVNVFDKSFTAKYNTGAIYFTADGNTAYFTRNQVKAKGTNLLEIWSANKVGATWSNFTKLALNDSLSSAMHPALNKEENKLYFVSDRQGGQGGTDLYYVEKEAGGNWGTAVNAGSVVNTPANELYPTVMEGQLYISSNGHAGLGGLDIYKVNVSNNTIKSVENIGYPVNSNGDDMSFSKLGKKGYFNSNRFGSDDIFAYDFELAKITVTGTVKVNNADTKGPFTIKFYEGNKATGTPTETIVSPNGDYSVQLRPNRTFTIEATEPGGNKNNATVNSNNYIVKKAGVYAKAIDALLINIPPPPPPPAPVEAVAKTFDNIIDSLKALTKDFVMLHHEFDLTTVVKEDLKAYNAIIAKAKAVKGARVIVISAADCKGNADYNERLSTRRSDAIGGLLAKKNPKNTIIKMHLGERILVKPCDDAATKAEQVVNRYTYVFVQK